MKENESLAIALNRVIGQEVNKVLDKVLADVIDCADSRRSITVISVKKILDKYKAEGSENE